MACTDVDRGAACRDMDRIVACGPVGGNVGCGFGKVGEGAASGGVDKILNCGGVGGLEEQLAVFDFRAVCGWSRNLCVYCRVLDRVGIWIDMLLVGLKIKMCFVGM